MLQIINENSKREYLGCPSGDDHDFVVLKNGFNQRCAENLEGKWWYHNKKTWIEHKGIEIECAEDIDGKKRKWRSCEKTCPTEFQVDCGPTSVCKFPFVYKNVTYKHCTPTDSIAPWCATDSPYKKGGWEFCDKTCSLDNSNVMVPITISIAVVLFIMSLAFFIFSRKKGKKWKSTMQKRILSLENRRAVANEYETSTGSSNTDDVITYTVNGKFADFHSDPNEIGYVDMATPTILRKNYNDEEVFRRKYVNNAEIFFNEPPLPKVRPQMKGSSTLRDDEEVSVRMRKQEIVKNLAGDPSKVDRRRTINEQISFLAYNPEVEIERNSFETDRILGNGNFGTIFIGHKLDEINKECRTRVAIKTASNTMDSEAIFSIICEMKILSNLKLHINIVNLVGCCTSEYAINGNLWILLEYCERGDMKTFLINNRQDFILHLSNKTEKNEEERHGYGAGGNNGDYNLPKKKDGNSATNSYVLDTRLLLFWCYGIAKGMEYLSSEKVMHGDLAARNILIRMVNGHLIPKVADFGLSKRFYNDTSYHKKNRPHIPYKWMALEYLLDGLFHLSSDVWSYGVLLWEIFSLGREPYPGKEYDNIIIMLRNGYTLPCPEDVKNYTGEWSPNDFYEVISGECFNLDPSKRALFTTIVKFIEKHLTNEEILEYQKFRNPKN